MGVSPVTRQDRGLRPRDRPWATRASAGRSLDHESVFAFCRQGRNGNYLFELEAQPGGPEGRSDNMTGSQPITKPERPRSVPALRSCQVLVVAGPNRNFSTVALRPEPGTYQENRSSREVQTTFYHSSYPLTWAEAPLGLHPSRTYTKIPANNENGLAMHDLSDRFRCP